MFGEMMGSVYRLIFERFFRVAVVNERGDAGPRRVSFVKEEVEEMRAAAAQQEAAAQAASKGDAPKRRPKGETIKRDAPKVGRNEPCPCGSGKKYKHCCGNPRNIA